MIRSARRELYTKGWGQLPTVQKIEIVIETVFVLIMLAPIVLLPHSREFWIFTLCVIAALGIFVYTLTRFVK